jgi:hypothetical protein
MYFNSRARINDAGMFMMRIAVLPSEGWSVVMRARGANEYTEHVWQ